MAALVKAFAQATGRSLRTAQRCRAQASEDWKRFVGTQAIASMGSRTVGNVAALASVSPILPAEQTPEVAARRDEELSPAQQMEKQHWLIWVQASTNWKRATIANDEGKAAGFALICIKARSEYIKARDARERWEQDQRRVVSMSEFTAFRAQFVSPLAAMLRNLPGELSSLVNPADPNFALTQATAYFQQRLQPQIQKLIDGIEEYIPAA